MAKNRNKRKKRKGPPAVETPAPAETPESPGASGGVGRLLGLIVVAGVAAVALTYIIAYSIPLEEVELPTNGSSTSPSQALAVPADDDPSKDGWDSEVLSQAAQDQLKKLAKLWTSGGSFQEASPLLSDDFRGQSLRPEKLATRYETLGVSVLHGGSKDAAKLNADAWFRTGDAMSKAFDKAERAHFEVKIFGFEQLDDGFATEVRFQAAATKTNRSVQWQSVWRCRWELKSSEKKPKLRELLVQRYEEIQNSGDPASLFVDCTRAAMRGVEAYETQLVPGYEEWFRRTPQIFDRKLWAEHGLAVGDADGDGRDDVYLCEPGALPNRLLIHNPDGTVADRSAAGGVDWYDQTRSALFLDLDNDGDQDLVIAITGRILMMENDGAARFKVRFESTAAPATHAMAAADFDLDGKIDIYACSYYEEDAGDSEYQVPIPYNDATNGGRNVLLKNEGDWRFRDATAETGLDSANNRWSLAASFEDFDNDGDADLYVANDFGRNCLYQNNDGMFVNVAAEAGVEDVGSGMSVAWADYNNDGLMDVYVSNMFSTAGGRITNQRQFQEGASDAEKARFRRMAKGNTLFANKGDGTFEDVSEHAAVARARWAWGAPFIDINNDGWEDLIVANGFLTREDTRDL